MENELHVMKNESDQVNPEDIAFGVKKTIKFHGRMTELPESEPGEIPIHNGLTRGQILFLGSLEEERRQELDRVARFTQPEIGPSILLPDNSIELNRFLRREGR